VEEHPGLLAPVEYHLAEQSARQRRDEIIVFIIKRYGDRDRMVGLAVDH